MKRGTRRLAVATALLVLGLALIALACPERAAPRATLGDDPPAPAGPAHHVVDARLAAAG